MTKYVNNLNTYLSQRKIKQTYISMKSGIDTKKLSRILTGIQDISATDMERIAEALGRKADFFLNDCIPDAPVSDFDPGKVFFYAGEPTQKQEWIADRLLKLLQNIDEVMGAKERFLNMAKG